MASGPAAEVAELLSFRLYSEAARRLGRLGPEEFNTVVWELAASNPEGLVRLAVELAGDPAAFGRLLGALRGSPGAVAVLSALAGAGLWTFFLGLIVLLPATVSLARERRARGKIESG